MDSELPIIHSSDVEKPKVVLLKILGITTPWNFARHTLVNYAIDKCHDFISRNYDEGYMTKIVEQLFVQNQKQLEDGLQCPKLSPRALIEQSAHKDELAKYVVWCIQQNMYKFGTPVNDLQSQIWGEGYVNGSLKVEIYPEVFEIIKNWKSQNIKVYTFSSGNIEGQRTYFTYTTIGDISKYLDGHISSSHSGTDKYDTGCYARVSLITGEERNTILFLTNSTAEAKAATISGIQTILVQRENNFGIVEEDAKYFTRISNLNDLKFKK